MSPSSATLLALDTATDTLAIAVRGPRGCFTHEAAGGALASAQLIPQALALLAQAGCTLADVDAIAFGRGPGAFTGLRTACSVAQGLALGAGKPVLALDSLLIVAEDARSQIGGNAPLSLWVAMDARMDEVYAQACQWDGLHWRVTTPALLCSPEHLRAHWQAEPAHVIAGSALSVHAARLGLAPAPQTSPSGTATPRQMATTASRAHALLRLADAAWAAGEQLDAALALPVYVRDKVAQTMAERLALRAAPGAP